MFVLINCSYDGDTYNLFNKIETAREEFDAACNSGFYYKVLLVKPDSIGQEFGFGSRGDFFGAELIFEFEEEDQEEEESSPVCGACGGDATICDGC